MKIIYFLVAMILGSATALSAEPNKAEGEKKENNKRQFYDELVDRSFLNERVVVKGDTVPIILKERNYGRYDRGLYNFLFIPKGQFALGLTANYGSFDSKDVQLLSVIDDFDFKGTIYSIKPSFAYFIRNNQSLGIKLNYTKGEADLGSLAVDIDDDLNFDIKGVKYTSHSVAGAIFYRNYVGLGRSKRFAVFNEVDLSFGGGKSRFIRHYNGVPRDTRTTSFETAINFSPGLCVFIQEYVSFNLSFGVFGVKFRNEKQTTDNEFDGSRFSTGANFRFNVFNINFGLGIHI